MRMRTLTAEMRTLTRTLTATRCRRCLPFCMVKRPISLAEQEQGGRAEAVPQAYAAENSSDSGFSGPD